MVIIPTGLCGFANIAWVSCIGECVTLLWIWGHVIYGIGVSHHSSCDSVLDTDLLFMFMLVFKYIRVNLGITLHWQSSLLQNIDRVVALIFLFKCLVM